MSRPRKLIPNKNRHSSFAIKILIAINIFLVMTATLILGIAIYV